MRLYSRDVLASHQSHRAPADARAPNNSVIGCVATQDTDRPFGRNVLMKVFAGGTKRGIASGQSVSIISVRIPPAPREPTHDVMTPLL